MSKRNKLQNYSQNTQPHLLSQSVTFSGPLPHPDILKKFDDVFPGAAKIIVEMAQNQSEHRQELEKSVIASDIKNSKLGLYFGFIIGMTGIIGGTTIIIFESVWPGLSLSLMSLASLVGTFVYGSQGRKKEREEKNK
jgi:uncharacterized membrane protein